MPSLIVKIVILVFATFIACSSKSTKTEAAISDKVELLKSSLLNLGFHDDAQYNKHYEYSWGLAIYTEDTLLEREAQLFLTDTFCYSSEAKNCISNECYRLTVKEYRFRPGQERAYSDIFFKSLHVPKSIVQEPDAAYPGYGAGSPRKRNAVAETLLVALENRFVVVEIKEIYSKQSDRAFLGDVLAIIQRGLLASQKDTAVKNYSLLDTMARIKNSRILAETDITDTNSVLLDIEFARQQNWNTYRNSRSGLCRCIDLMGEPDSNRPIGYITISLYNNNGLPAQNVDCILRDAEGLESMNKTDSSGCVKWCRACSGEYTMEIALADGIQTFRVPWDSFPRAHYIDLQSN